MIIKEFIKKHLNDYLDSGGHYDTIGLIELVRKEFGCSTQHAEEYVTEVLGEE